MTSTTDSGETRTYEVGGMTCEHCRASVREEVAEVPGVDGVDVDLATWPMVVRGDGFDDAAVRDAVAEAGYEVAS